ncbi:MAG: hypothetical protein OEZ68_13260 [Gammaproteobacteria bacterium]|nr:hypothetical protein [Gammaproteobacteria bacterium]MDH5801768.1 hypothetical protein [Gammaproteobacteria bacterium]
MYWLLYLQFGLLYLPLLIIGLVVYGSDFDSSTAWISLLPLVSLPALHQVYRHIPWAQGFIKSTSKLTSTVAPLLGALLALMLARLLYFHVWDEHSLLQAALLAGLTVCSYLSSLAAVAYIHQVQGQGSRRPAARAVMIIGLVWLAASYFPFVGFLAIAMILALALVWRPASMSTTADAVADHPPMASYVSFVLALDVFLVVWDWQVQAQWALYLGLSFGGVATAILVNLGQRLLWPLLVGLVLLKCLLLIIWPQWVLSPLHAFVAGLLWGAIAQWFLPMGGRDHSGRLWLSLAVALLLGYALYANLAYSWARVLLLLPLLYPWVRGGLRKKQA